MESQASTPEPDQESKSSNQSLPQVDNDVVSSSSLTSSGESSAMEPSLLLLPLELILIIIRLLPTPDRMRARVNRMLYQLESPQEFHLRELTIGSPGCDYFRDGAELIMTLVGPREAYVEGLKKMATNVKIGYLSYKCENVNDQLLFPYIRNLRADKLWINLTEQHQDPMLDSASEAELTDDNLYEWMNGKKKVNIMGKFSCSGEILHRTFLEMASGQSSLTEMELLGIHPSACYDFLQRLGIAHTTGHFGCVIGRIGIDISIEMDDWAILEIEKR